MFWVDEISEKIISKYKKNKYLVTDWFTPSGKAHVGSLRGVVVHDLARQALCEKGKEAFFQYGFDDFDPMDGFPYYLPEEYKKYMGMPFSEIPSPDKKYNSLGEYFAIVFFQEIFNSMGIKPKLVYTSKLYKDGIFNGAIKIILLNADKVRDLYFSISKSKKDSNWFPLSVKCEKCGKIGTTKVNSYDKSKDKVKYRCEPKMVEWAEGCNYEGWISPYNGNAKLPWKPEWPSKWYIFKNDVEGEGKDHFVAGGSREVANAISRAIFHHEPPFDIRYEHFQIGGKKMSSSKGTGAFAKDIAEIIPAEILKFLMVRTRPQKTIEFDINGDTIPLLYDEYDRCIDEYLRDPKSDFGQAYHYSKISKNNPPKYRLRFSKVVYLIQMFRTSIEDYAKEEKGSHLTKDELSELKIREKYARLWLTKYAPENYKFEIQEKLPKSAENLDKGQKEFLSGIIKALSEKKWLGDELHAKIHEIKNELKLDPRRAFSAIYLSILDKDSGPQAGWLLASLDRDFVVKRFKEVTK